MKLSRFRQLQHSANGQGRRGSFLPLGVAGMLVTFTFVSFSVDLGLISLTRERMQNTVDAAALAAAQDITLSVREAGEDYQGEGEVNPIVISEERARAAAIKTGELNGLFIAEEDVVFGKRIVNEDGEYEIQWGSTPYNVVKVTARKDQDDMSAPDAKLKLFFAGIFGEDKVTLRTHATAFVEARDMVMVLDFSASMNDDSEVKSYDSLGYEAVLQNQRDIYDALELDSQDGDLTFDAQYFREGGKEPSNSFQAKIHVTYKGNTARVESTKDITQVRLYFDNGNSQTLSKSGSDIVVQGTSSNSSRNIVRVDVKSGSTKSGDSSTYGETFQISNSEVQEYFGLDGLDFVNEEGSWTHYVNYAMAVSGSNGDPYGEVKPAGVSYMFGGQTLVNYLIRLWPEHHNTPDHWKTPAQPVNALKNGVKLFSDYLDDLQFSDYVGVVTYCDAAALETTAFDADLGINVNISQNPLTNNYDDIYQLVRFKQAGHYSRNTGMGPGIERGIQLLEDEARLGTKKTLVIMTDGIANISPSGFSLPGNWNWDNLTDYDKDGDADYSTGDKHKQHAFYQVKRAIDKGYTVHAITVGQGADDALLKAIAHAGGGVWMDVPGGSTIADLEDQMRAAFAQIAAHVPPPKLINAE